MTKMLSPEEIEKYRLQITSTYPTHIALSLDRIFSEPTDNHLRVLLGL